MILHGLAGVKNLLHFISWNFHPGTPAGAGAVPGQRSWIRGKFGGTLVLCRKEA